MPTLPNFTSPEGEAATLRAYQAILDQWPVPYTDLTIPTSFGYTKVVVSGPEDAPPVVLLHALFATAMSWHRCVEFLSKGYRVYAVDIVGEANRSKPTCPIKSLDDFLQWFTELLDGLKIDQLYLVGNSFGGFTAAYYAMHLPQRIRKLALIGPAATIHKMPAFYINMFIPKMLYLFFPWLPGITPRMKKSVRWMRAGLPANPAWEQLFEQVLVHGSMTTQVFPRVYTIEEMAQIQCPTLLILGDKEQIYSHASASKAAKVLLPKIQVEIIPAAHHIAAISQPEKVSECLIQFFNK